MEKELQEARELIKELIQHLDYCGWGDSYERELSKELQEESYRYLDKYGIEK